MVQSIGMACLCLCLTRNACLMASVSEAAEVSLPACRLDCRDDCSTVYACWERTY